jgi:SAM-dependent methyltransferase
MKGTPYHPSMHLAAEQIISAEDRCPVCGVQSNRTRAGVLQRDPAIYLLECPHCRACSASHMPAPEFLSAYYSRYFKANGPKITMPQVNRFAERLLRAAHPRAVPRPFRMLDFGGGDGTLGLAVAKKILARDTANSVEFTLVDYQKPDPAQTHERLAVAHRETVDAVNGPFDLVIASAVLEHIPGLKGVLEKLFASLAPGGWFYARTPYLVPLKRLLPALDITYPGHVHDLGAPFWNRVPTTYRQPLQILVSRPSLIETDPLRQPIRSAAAWLMKLPARVELTFSRSRRTPLWRLVGGWEVVLRRQITSSSQRSQ